MDVVESSPLCSYRIVSYIHTWLAGWLTAAAAAAAVGASGAGTKASDAASSRVRPSSRMRAWRCLCMVLLSSDWLCGGRKEEVSKTHDDDGVGPASLGMMPGS